MENVKDLDLGHIDTGFGACVAPTCNAGHLQAKHSRRPRAAVLVRAPRRACGAGEEEEKGAQAKLRRVSVAAGWQPVPPGA